MHHLWQSLLEFLWPSRRLPLELHRRREALLYAAIAIAISLAAGPEVYAAMEMTTLLELLGATLFLAAFSAGARLVAENLWRAACNLVFPAPHLAVMKSDASWAAKALALTFVAAHWLSPLMLGRGRVWVIKLAA